MYRSKGKISCCSFETEWNEMYGAQNETYIED